MTRADAISPADLYDRVPCGLVTVTANGRIIRANETFRAWTGLGGDRLLGMPLTDLLEPGARIFHETRFLPILQLKGEVREVALSIRTSQDAGLPVLVNAVVDAAGDEPLTHIAVFDASLRQDYERQLLAARRIAESSEARTRVLQNATTAFGASETIDGLAQALATSVHTGLGATAAAVELGGHAAQVVGASLDDALLPEVLADRMRDRSPDDETVLLVSARDAADTAGTPAALRAARLDTVLLAPLVSGGTTVGTLACYFARRPDLDESTTDLVRSLSRQAVQTFARLQLQAQLAVLALYDPLTGLANRNLLREHLAKSIEAALERNEPLSLIFVDLDDFKSINDDLDHTAGDTVLKLIAARLAGAVRGDDLVGRFGGDEFIIVCRNTDFERASVVAERVRLAIRQPLAADGWQRTITASVGVTVRPAGSARPLVGSDLFRVADRAMYRSKAQGKDQVSVIAL
ncbi:diguanylate cyclase [Leifsonia sp. fls2-241-R2A-40a]|uniref:sensor domain-containing protein n=1 Tax=Leifsonia sp. fls2-241-R2A-40a TaxID=3040290 RepID=UPI00254E5029|nr:diguanylate cyclase [Leifsonia sp. fls2-241-R2A-40a]